MWGLIKVCLLAVFIVLFFVGMTYYSNREYIAEKLGGVNEVIFDKGAQYAEFDKIKYEEANENNKTILLYFSSSLDPLRATEEMEIEKAFEDLNGSVTGFRVNFEDAETDNDEIALAEEMGIKESHTKVVIVNGIVQFSSEELIDSEKVVDWLS